MNQLFEFLKRIRNLLLLIGLELVCVFLMVRQNSYQQYAFLSSASGVTGSIAYARDGVLGYFKLASTNRSLQEENAQLQEKLRMYERYQEAFDLQNTKVTAYRDFDYIPAAVLQQSVHFANNYITINKGSADGIKPGMGVSSGRGVVGKVKACSKHFSVVTTILHDNLRIGARIKRTGNLGSLVWDGKDISMAKLEFVPRHVKLMPGDEVVTARSTIFPAGIPCGEVRSAAFNNNTDQLEIDVKLAVDFSTLSTVYAIVHEDAPELDSLETSINNTK